MYSESSDQDVRKSDDQALLKDNFNKHENLLGFHSRRSRIRALFLVKSSEQGKFQQSKLLILVTSVWHEIVSGVQWLCLPLNGFQDVSGLNKRSVGK